MGHKLLASSTVTLERVEVLTSTPGGLALINGGPTGHLRGEPPHRHVISNGPLTYPRCYKVKGVQISERGNSALDYHNQKQTVALPERDLTDNIFAPLNSARVGAHDRQSSARP